MHYTLTNIIDAPAICQFLTDRFSIASKHFIQCLPYLSRQ